MRLSYCNCPPNSRVGSQSSKATGGGEPQKWDVEPCKSEKVKSCMRWREVVYVKYTHLWVSFFFHRSVLLVYLYVSGNEKKSRCEIMRIDWWKFNWNRTDFNFNRRPACLTSEPNFHLLNQAVRKLTWALLTRKDWLTWGEYSSRNVCCANYKSFVNCFWVMLAIWRLWVTKKRLLVL